MTSKPNMETKKVRKPITKKDLKLIKKDMKKIIDFLEDYLSKQKKQ